jgi:hypothetical protein
VTLFHFLTGVLGVVIPLSDWLWNGPSPSRGTYQLAFALITAATPMLVAGRRASARKDSRGVRSREFGVILLSAWALYPMLPALLTVWF